MFVRLSVLEADGAVCTGGISGIFKGSASSDAPIDPEA
jgi:hypothetical protein